MNIIKFHIFAFLFMILSNNFSSASSDWSVVFDTYNKRFDHALVFDSSHAVIMGFYNPTGIPKLYATSDGGVKWVQTFSDSLLFHEPEYRGGMIKPLSISKTNDNIIYVSCDSGYYFKSYDKGFTWQRFKSRIDTGFSKILMVNSDFGYGIIGNRLISIKEEFDSFEQVTNDIDDDIFYFFDFAIHQDSILVAIAGSLKSKDVYFLKSIDYGQDWEFSQLDYLTNYSKIFSFDDTNLWIMLFHGESIDNQIYNPDKIIVSSDAGLNWETSLYYLNDPVSNGKPQIVRNLHFLDRKHGIASGYGGKIQITNDGGQTWQIQQFSNNLIYDKYFTSCFRLTPETAFATSLDGLIYKNSQSLLTTVNEINESAFSIHPNPASEYIEIALHNKGACSLANGVQIYNTLGECVITVETIHELSLQKIDVSHLPRGVYYVRIGSRTQMFVKV